MEICSEVWVVLGGLIRCVLAECVVFTTCHVAHSDILDSHLLYLLFFNNATVFVEVFQHEGHERVPHRWRLLYNALTITVFLLTNSWLVVQKLEQGHFARLLAKHALLSFRVKFIADIPSAPIRTCLLLSSIGAIFGNGRVISPSRHKLHLFYLLKQVLNIINPTVTHRYTILVASFLRGTLIFLDSSQHRRMYLLILTLFCLLFCLLLTKDELSWLLRQWLHLVSSLRLL